MVKTLRITSYLLAAGAACSVIFIVALGFKGDPEIQAFLDRKGVIETLKTQSQATPQKGDVVSPLVTQAQKFALRIDPPPPPVPVTPPTTPRPERATPTPERVEPPVVTPPPASGRLSLLATARSEDNPGQSLALLKPLVGPSKWYRQGETVNYLEIREIRDGSVVLYQAGKMNSELFVPKPAAQSKSLLKSEAGTSADTSGPARAATAAASETSSTADASAQPAETGRPIRVLRDASRTPPTRTVDAASRIQRVTAPPREQTRQDQKESLDQSISSIEEIMSRSESQGSAEEQKQEQEAWMQLLQVLQKEKTALETSDSESAEAEAESEAPQTDDAEESGTPPAADASESSEG